MLIFFAAITFFATLLMVPGWLLARKWHSQSLWFLGMPLVGITLWVLLSILGIGAQSLANLVEVFVVAISAVMAAYLKFLVFDRQASMSALGVRIALAIVVIVTLSLRLCMPLLPE